MTDISELLADVQAVTRTLRLSVSGRARRAVDAIADDLDEIATVAVVRNVRARSRASNTLARARRDLLEALRQSSRDRRQRLTRLQREVAASLAEVEELAARGEEADRRKDVDRSEEGVRAAAMSCRLDAERKSTFVVVLYLFALAAVVVATAMGWYLVIRQTQTPDVPATAFLVRWTPAAALLAAAFFLAHQAARVARAADELRRLERQLVGLTAYLRPLPPDARNLMLAAMTPRLFPRLLDDDPLREEDWFPDEEILLASINPDLLPSDEDADHEDDRLGEQSRFASFLPSRERS